MSTKIMCPTCDKKFGSIKIHSHYPACIASKYSEYAGHIVSFTSHGITGKLHFLYCIFPSNTTLSTLDTFMRKIWCECCGHMSMFVNADRDEYDKNSKIKDYPDDTRMIYEYDMGTSTTVYVTFHSTLSGSNSIKNPLIIARNSEIVYKCKKCKSKASKWLYGDPLCDECSKKMMLNKKCCYQ